MPEILTPCCPLCGMPPFLLLGGGTQAFCGTDDCRVFTWNPALSAEENLADPGLIEFPPPEGGAGD